MVAPTNGAKINTQTWDKAFPPRKIAGDKLLAGLTDVPVRLIPIRCTNVRVNPITIPATDDLVSSLVTPRIVYTNTNVNTHSVIKEPSKVILVADRVPYPFAPSEETPMLVLINIKYNMAVPANAPKI